MLLLAQQFVFNFVWNLVLGIWNFPAVGGVGRGVPNGKVPLSKSGGRKPMRVQLSPPPPRTKFIVINFYVAGT